MNTREIAAEYRLTHWAGIMRERKESGQSIRGFCANAGIREHAYYYWQRKLREAANRDLGLLADTPKPPAPSGWLVCARESVAESPIMPSKTTDSVVIEIGDCRVYISTDVDESLLTKVLRALKGQC